SSWYRLASPAASPLATPSWNAWATALTSATVIGPSSRSAQLDGASLTGRLRWRQRTTRYLTCVTPADATTSTGSSMGASRRRVVPRHRPAPRRVAVRHAAPGGRPVEAGGRGPGELRSRAPARWVLRGDAGPPLARRGHRVRRLRRPLDLARQRAGHDVERA